MSYDDNDAQSYVSSLGPQLGQGGRVVRPAQIVVYPFGPDPLAAAAGKVPLLKPGMVALHLSLDEAEALAEKLIDVGTRGPEQCLKSVDRLGMGRTFPGDRLKVPS